MGAPQGAPSTAKSVHLLSLHSAVHFPPSERAWPLAGHAGMECGLYTGPGQAEVEAQKEVPVTADLAHQSAALC